MPQTLSEKDWKVFRRLHEVALERFCQRALTEMAQTCTDENRSCYERFVAVSDTLQKRNGELAAAFDDARRSAAVEQVLLLRRRQLLTDVEFAEFTLLSRSSFAAR
jgi:hypothetical protein